MNYLTADASMCDHLRGIVEPVEVRDRSGRLLGVFTPHVPPDVLAKYEKVKQLFDLDEINRIAATEREGLPLAEVWKQIRAGERS
jgi:hypothetical protein